MREISFHVQQISTAVLKGHNEVWRRNRRIWVSPKRLWFLQGRVFWFKVFLSLVILKIEICQNNSQYQTRQHYMFNKYTFFSLTQSKKRVVQAVRYIRAFYFLFYFNCNWNSVGWTEIGTCLFYEWIPATERVQNLECNFPYEDGRCSPSRKREDKSSNCQIPACIFLKAGTHLYQMLTGKFC